jgi:hypothetical protein
MANDSICGTEQSTRSSEPTKKTERSKEKMRSRLIYERSPSRRCLRSIQCAVPVRRSITQHKIRATLIFLKNLSNTSSTWPDCPRALPPCSLPRRHLISSRVNSQVNLQPPQIPQKVCISDSFEQTGSAAWKLKSFIRKELTETIRHKFLPV